MFSFVLAMTAAFLGAPAIGGDLESGVALALLARPLRRVDLLVGRWLGLAVVVVAATRSPPGPSRSRVVSGIAGLRATASGARDRVPRGAGRRAHELSPSRSGRSCPRSAPAPSPSWRSGSAGWRGSWPRRPSALGVAALAGAAEASRWLFPSDGLWRGVVYGLEPPAAALIAVGRSPAGLASQPVLRDRAATDAVPRLVDVLGRHRAGAGRSFADPARPLAPLRRGGGGPRIAIPEAAGDVVVDEADALHEGVDDRRADEPEAAPSKVRRERVGGRRRGRDVAGSRVGRHLAWRTRDAWTRDRPRTSRTRRSSRGTARRSRSWRRSSPGCGRSRRRP